MEQAVDMDGVRSGQTHSARNGNPIFYTIEEGNTADGLFSIDHDSGVVELTRPLNASVLGEMRFLLTVRATDAGTPPQHSDAVVVVSVGAVDGNDPPRFRQEAYSLHIAEHSPPDSFVIQVRLPITLLFKIISNIFIKLYFYSIHRYSYVPHMIFQLLIAFIHLICLRLKGSSKEKEK